MKKNLKFLADPNLRTKLSEYFLAGILLIGPLYITIIILKFGVEIISDPLQPVVIHLMKWLPNVLIEYVATFFSLILTLLIIICCGFIGQKVIGKRIISWVERLMIKFPVIGAVYSTIKEFFTAFSSKDKYKSVVFVKLFHDDYKSLGFVTHESVDENGKKRYRIFVPTIPNPTTGYLLFTSEDSIQFSTMTVEKALRIMLSGGVLELESKVTPPAPPDNRTN